MRLQLLVSVVAFGLLTGCAATIDLAGGRTARMAAPGQIDHESRAQEAAAGEKQASSGPDVPVSLFDEAGVLMAEARNCVVAYNKSVDQRNRSNIGNILFKVGEVTAATGFTVLTGVNSQISGNADESPKQGLAVGSIVSAAIFTGLATFDTWYNFSERTTNQEQDATDRLTHLERAGFLYQCAKDADVADATRYEHIKYEAVASAKSINPKAPLVGLLESPELRGPSWRKGVEKELAAFERRHLALEKALDAQPGTPTADSNKAILKEHLGQAVTDAIEDSGANMADKDNVKTAAKDAVQERRLAIIALADFGASPFSCGDAGPKTAMDFRTQGHAELVTCLTQRPSSFGSPPQSPPGTSTSQNN